MVAHAVRISNQNRQAIASEHRKFDKEEFAEWIKTHETGYFVRDPGSPFDCRYLDDVVFHEIYRFESNDIDALFRKIDPIDKS